MSTTSPEIGTGYLRHDGHIGLRNHVVALSTVALTDRVTERAVGRVPSALLIAPRWERGVRGRDASLQDHALRAIATHPNTGALLAVTHDRGAADALRSALADCGRPFEVVTLMGSGGYDAAIDAAARSLERLTAQTQQTPRAPLCLGDLTVALECGGSDASSATCANPAIGRFVDELIAAGGTAIVSETAEFIGSEPVIHAQSESPAIAQAILACIAAEEAMMRADGTDYRGVNPTRENIEAGLSTLIEKTMGAVCKIGTSKFVGCLAFAQKPERSGLYFMDTPFFSPVSLSGMVLSGAQVTLFAMGVYNPSGMPLAPTIKICGNPQTLRDWGAEIDVNVEGLIGGIVTLDMAAVAITDTLAALCAGSITHAERRGEGQLILPRTMPAL
ncbi:UxaA family hydrolase [Marivita sp.]|uniref:UxaA family hydrolase n=1 Tax=Marivita sp. TaxID=2003365 RepID=UPI0025B87ACA|nr:UxaA family hydrolase [Marivita sp.]